MIPILKWLDDNVEEVLLGILLIVMTFIMGVQVVARYAFNYSLTWSEEITRYMFIWSGFLSISYCYRKKIAIRIEQAVSALPKSLEKIFRIIEKVIALIFFIYMIPFAYKFLQASIISGQLSPAVRLPMYLVQVAPLVGFILTTIRIIEEIIHEVRIKNN